MLPEQAAPALSIQKDCLLKSGKGDVNMRRYIVLMLVLALIFSNSVVGAGTEDVADYIVGADAVFEAVDTSIFAKLTASVPDKYDRVTVTLSEPVDRIWANWMGPGEKPEELFLNSHNSATFSTKGHPYQVGTMPPAEQELIRTESTRRYTIEFGALDSQINWRTIQAQQDAEHGECVKTVVPHWLLIRKHDGVIMNIYEDKLTSGDIKADAEVAEKLKYGYYELQRVDGYAVGWHFTSNGSDGSPNLAYITLQKGYVVIYGRNGTIQVVKKYVPGMKVFGIDVGATDKSEDWERVLYAYYVSKEITEYENLPELPPIASFAQMDTINSKDGKSIKVILDRPVDRIWANWMGKNEGPEELELDEKNRTVVSTVGHKYQIGARWVGEFSEGEVGSRQSIVWGAYPSYVQWAIGQAKQTDENYGYVKVVLPHWELQEITTGNVVKEYDDSHTCHDIFVPDGYKLVKQEGYAVAYQKQAVASDGSPNIAYITEQDGWMVYYSRIGQIVMVTKTLPQSNFFEAGTGTATVVYKKSEFGRWIVSDITEVYADNRSITAVYSRYGTGKLEDYQVSNF